MQISPRRNAAMDSFYIPQSTQQISSQAGPPAHGSIPSPRHRKA